MTLRRSLITAIVVAVLAGILLGGLALTGAGSLVSKAVPSQLRGDRGDSEPDENENERDEGAREQGTDNGVSEPDENDNAPAEPDERGDGSDEG
jgi:hypothetical protein